MKWFIVTIVFFFFHISGFIPARAQTESLVQPDTLCSIYTINKMIDSVTFRPVLKAIQKYPDLADCHIEFRYKKLNTLMAARPTMDFLFCRKENRKYVIFVSTNSSNNCRKVFSRMSEQSMTGIIGHELAHIVDY
ncbi:MAG: hypothetical protein HC906_12380, partial [Bacteroidales bacterium]|nr:hypothetical protein [Bacteroidales bacterium]